MAPGGEGPRCQEKRISRMSDMVTENRSLEVTSDFSESSFYGVLGAGGLSRKEGKSGISTTSGGFVVRETGKSMVVERGCRILGLFVCFLKWG